jgi:hypothetical protein
LVAATGFPEFITQMYFKGDDVVDHDWIQELNEKDLILQNSSITNDQRNKLVVEFKRRLLPSLTGNNELEGEFNIALKR